MNKDNQYLEITRQSWNQRTEVHLTSAFYDHENFLKGNSSLKNIETSLLGDIRGKSVLHLQCHFGQDTISLSRLGAEACGVDFSDKAIDAARQAAEDTKSGTEFICCDLYDLHQHLDKQFDIVFTSYGTIGWLPDLNKWAAIISRFLKPEGRFIFVEFHPVVWMFDDNFRHIAYRYFNSGPLEETEEGTYAEKGADLKLEYVMWNHGLGEVMNSLLQNGLEILSLEEYDYSPYNCFNETEEYESGKFRIKHLGNNIPMLYSISAKKKS